MNKHVVKVPQVITLGAHTFKINVSRHLKTNGDGYGIANMRTQRIIIDNNYTESFMQATLIHEILHLVDRQYSTGIEEANIERISEGVAEFLKEIGISLDWSDITVAEPPTP